MAWHLNDVMVWCEVLKLKHSRKKNGCQTCTETQQLPTSQDFVGSRSYSTSFTLYTLMAATNVGLSYYSKINSVEEGYQSRTSISETS